MESMMEHEDIQAWFGVAVVFLIFACILMFSASVWLFFNL